MKFGNPQNALAREASIKKRTKATKKRILKPLALYPSLAEEKSKSKQFRPRSVAIVTTDLKRPFVFSGGVAVANLAIAESLGRAGHKVTIFYISRQYIPAEEFHGWQLWYSERNVELRWLNEPHIILQGMDAARLSYAAYLQLRDEKFDIIHFPDLHGVGYYTALAKSLGLDFHNSIICVELHGPGFWGKLGNEEVLANPDELLKCFLERKSVEFSDVLICPTQYIADRIANEGWKYPKKTYVEQLPLCLDETIKARGNTEKIDEIVFFGRLETRKGIVEFCDALDLLPQNFLKEKGISVTFLGAHGSAKWISSRDYLSHRGLSWIHQWKTISEYSQEEALKYIAARNVLVVVPSREESMGYTVLECLRLGVPFIASDIPAFREIVDKEFHKDVLVNTNPESLKTKILDVLKRGSRRARFAKEPDLSAKIWAQWHSDVELPSEKKKTMPVKRPLVSVCVTHRNRPGLLLQCIRSLEEQTYKNLEVILMDDASDTPEAIQCLKSLRKRFGKKKWQIVQQKECVGPSANRNQAAQLAKGEYILFMDDDNVAKPEEIATFLIAAENSDADILTCSCDRFHGSKYPTGKPEMRCMPVGDVRGLNLLLNLLGDMNFFVKRKVFLDLGGMRHQEKNVGAEDAEFLARATFRGYNLEVVPEALFWYRLHDKNFSSIVKEFETLMMRVNPYYEEFNNPDMKQLMSFSLGVWYRYFQQEMTPGERLFPTNRNVAPSTISLYRKRLFFADVKSGISNKAEVKFGSVNEEEWGLTVSESGRIGLPELNLSDVRRLYVEMEAACLGSGTIKLNVGRELKSAKPVFESEVRPLFRGNNQIKFYIDLPKVINPIELAINLDEKATLEVTKIEVLGDS